MLINVNKISEKGYSVQDALDADGDLLLEKNSQFLEELNYQIVFKRDGNRIRAQGKIKTSILIPCGRCMELFEFKIHSTFDIILFPLELLDPSHGGSLPPDEMEYIFYEGDQIDLRKLLTEQINLFLPLYPLCQETCSGICPTCGTNLNHSTCLCDPKPGTISFSFDKLKR